MARPLYICGDSVFDNDVYVKPELNFHDHMRALSGGRETIKLAMDGAVIEDTYKSQLPHIRSKHPILVISAGGNDGLEHMPLLRSMRPRLFINAVGKLADIQLDFRMHYRRLLKAATEITSDVMVCTIYRPCYAKDRMFKVVAKQIEPVLSMFNDVIIEESAIKGVEVLDLRRVCRIKSHFANAIEPSSRGAFVIARHVTEWVDQIDPM